MRGGSKAEWRSYLSSGREPSRTGVCGMAKLAVRLLCCAVRPFGSGRCGCSECGSAVAGKRLTGSTFETGSRCFGCGDAPVRGSSKGPRSKGCRVLIHCPHCSNTGARSFERLVIPARPCAFRGASGSSQTTLHSKRAAAGHSSRVAVAKRRATAGSNAKFMKKTFCYRVFLNFN